MKTTTMKNVDGTLVVMDQVYFQDLLTTTKEKSMDQGKKMENMFTQETVWEL